MYRKRILISLFAIGIFLPVHLIFAGGISSTYKYAWSNNGGYINFENVIVGDNIISGYAWVKNYGWINMNPAKGGVRNDGNGDLSGFAWGEQLGWIDFNNVSINTATGKFSGTATGELIGTITFDCPTYCDVRTDWRPSTDTVVTPSPSIGNGGIVGSSVGAPANVQTNYINTFNQPMIVSEGQSGILKNNTKAGEVIVNVPANTSTGKVIFTITEESLVAGNQYLVSDDLELTNGSFYNITAKDDKGNAAHNFSGPLVITLPIPANMTDTSNLRVYYLDEVKWKWILIPDAIFSNGKVVFHVNHLTKFAIFNTLEFDADLDMIMKPSIALPVPKKPVDGILPIEKEGIVAPIEEDKTIIDKIKDFFGPGKIDSVNNATGTVSSTSEKQAKKDKLYFTTVPGLISEILSAIVVLILLAYINRKNK